VSFDRAATLRNAEKLLRQGKLDAAIAEYLRVVDDQPRDWNTANVLGDLYVKAGQTDKAVEQFIRIADSLNDEGFLPKAGALYKKILKLKPDHEHALIQAAEIASSQGLLADARNYLNVVGERRRSRGDKRGAAQMAIRLGSLDPADFDSRITGAKARVEVGDLDGAVSDLKAIAVELTELGRQPEALEVLRQAAGLNPQDETVKAQLLDVYVAAGDFARARECAVNAEQFRGLAAAMEAKGHADAALDSLREAARLEPGDVALRAQLARAFVARGDMQAAAEYLTVETAGDDPQLLVMAAEIMLRSSRGDDGLAIVRRLLEHDPSRREDMAAVGWRIADENPEAGFRVVELAADVAVGQTDWAAAAAALQEFVTRVPNHIPALMRLVEICVDGGLEATMYAAQAQLADAYIALGSADEARFIAEDLVAREPWERANIERFRRALVLLGEADPDAVIAERLSGQTPFVSTDLDADQDLLGFDPPAGGSSEVAAAPPANAPGAAPVVPTRPARPGPLTHFELGGSPVDIGSILGELEASMPAPEPPPPAPPPTVQPARDSGDTDLGLMLEDLKPGEAFASGAGDGSTRLSDIQSVLAQLRDEASRRPTGDGGDAQLALGLRLRQEGKIDEAIGALDAASRSPRHRFKAATLAGRLYREQNRLPQAIECFERAAQSPAPTVDEGHLLLYELADALEQVGETARALAVCLELQADAGDFRDVASRVDRLAKVQTRG